MDTNWIPALSGSDAPKYQALLTALQTAIRDGALTPGMRLPTVRDLAWRIHVTPGTVARAYQLAVAEGLLEAVVGRGTFVAGKMARPQLISDQGGGVVDLRTTHLPDVGQGRSLAEALRHSADLPDGGWMRYPTQGGEADLRQMVCTWLSDLVLGPHGPDDMVLTNGGQHGINLVLQSVLQRDRPVVLTEDLAYPGLRQAIRLARADTVGVEIDAEGMRPEALDAACRRYNPRLVCLTAEAQNPTTARMGMERRAALVAIARAHDVQLLEDDCYSTTISRLPSLRAMAPERTWYIGSLSKTISPALRMGWVVCASGMGEVTRANLQYSQFALAKPLTALCSRLFQSGEAGRIRTAVSAEMGQRLMILVNRLGAYDLAWQPGLSFAWLRLPTGWRAASFARAAEARGVLLRTADEYALIHARAPNAVRLSIPGNISREQLDEGLMTLAALLAQPQVELPV